MTEGPPAAEPRPLQVEMNGINVISESERKGHPRHLFWPWFAANISVLGLSYGSFVLGFGISFWQALVVGVAGIVVATGIGWGLVTNTAASWLTWQGYLLGPFGLGGKTGAWAFANLGVLVALAIGFVAHLVFGRADVRAEEAVPLPTPAAAGA